MRRGGHGPLREIALAAAIAAAAAPALGSAAVAGEWTAARDGGCEIWNADPLDGESLIWDGPCQDGKAHGEGTLTWFLDGERNGRYTGTLEAGHVVGEGVYEDRSGFRYEGEMGDHGPDGLGVAVYPDGMRYIGKWRDGRRHGAGVVHWPEGDRLEGTFEAGELDGEAVYVTPDGTRHEQVWKDGEQVK